MINAAMQGGEIIIRADKDHQYMIQRMSGTRRNKAMPVGCWLMPLTLEGIRHLRDAGAQFDGDLAKREDYMTRQQRWIEQQKSADHVEEWKPALIKEPYHLYQHQVKMYNIATVIPAFAAFAEMGTGKTLTAIAVAGYRFTQKTNPIKRLLIVAPASVCATWQREFAKYAAFPHKVAILLGVREKRVTALRQLMLPTMPGASEYLRVAVINYESTWRLEDELETFAPEMVICDESQHIKGYNTDQSKAMWSIGDRARYRMILSGTPVQNNTLDLWSQYRFLSPGLFGTRYTHFRDRYAILGGYGNHQYLAPKNIDELTRIAHSIALRVTTDECLDLPEQTFEDRVIELDPKTLSVYNRMKQQGIAELEGSEVTASIIITKLLRLRQITGGYLKGEDGVAVAVSKVNPKMDALLDIIESIAIGEGRKVVVFTLFTAEVHAIEERVGALFAKHAQASPNNPRLSSVTINGAIDAQKRGKIIERFQNDANTRVFIGQLDACSEGIELTAASTTVYYTLGYNYARYSQSLARTRRNGQRNACLYIHLVAENTIDEKLLKVLKKKEDLASSVIDNWRSYFED